MGEEAEALSFLGGLSTPPGSSWAVLSCPVLLAHPLPGRLRTARPRRPAPAPAPTPPAARSLLPSLQRPGPRFIPSTQASASADAAPLVCRPLCSEHAGSVSGQPVPPHSPAALGTNSGHRQGPSPSGTSRDQALSQPGLSPGYLCGQAGQESSGSLCLAPAGWPSTWPPGDRKAAWGW